MEESEGYPFVFQMIDRDSVDLSSLNIIRLTVYI